MLTTVVFAYLMSNGVALTERVSIKIDDIQAFYKGTTTYGDKTFKCMIALKKTIKDHYKYDSEETCEALEKRFLEERF